MNAPVPRPLALRPAPGEPAGAARRHGVLNALIEELPAPGEPFPQAKRDAWLALMATGFTLAYGNPGDQAVTLQSAVPAVAQKGAIEEGDAGFHIDKQGYARDAAGARILPEDVQGPLVDHRGEHGDLGNIIWSDETRGIPRGMQIDVTISPAASA